MKPFDFISVEYGLKPDPNMLLSEYADNYRILPKETSLEYGQYRTDRTPYLKEIMDELSPISFTREVVFIKGTQQGATEIGNNLLFCIAQFYPGPCLMAFPTEQMALKHSKKKIAKSILAMPILQSKILDSRKRDSGNTILLKEFPGGSWTFCGANSPTAARSDSIRYLILDDVDGYPIDMAGEGDPIGLFKNRTDAFGRKAKIYINSTPTLTGTSIIEREYAKSSMATYYIPCPHCGEFQRLLWKEYHKENYGIQFNVKDGIVIDVFAECKKCSGRIDEYMKTDFLSRGKWIHEYPERERKGYRLSSFYSPLGLLSWKQIAQEWHESSGNVLQLQRWVNTRAAESFEIQGEQPEWKALKYRAERYPLNILCSEKIQLLSAGVDVQNDRLVYLLTAWGANSECWILDFSEIIGDVLSHDTWKRLDERIQKPIHDHTNSRSLHLLNVAIDSGGIPGVSQIVYEFSRWRFPKVIAIKGFASFGKPVIGNPTLVDINYKGTKIKSGVNLFPVGVDSAKAMIYQFLKNTTPGANYIHFSKLLPDDFYLQLTAEKLITETAKTGYPKNTWVKVRERNEALDCMCYAYAGALRCGLENLKNTEDILRKEEKRLQIVKDRKQYIQRKHFNKSKRW